MFELAKAAGYLLSPLTIVLALGLAAALCAWRGRARWAARLAALAFVGLWVASTPVLGAWLVGSLEQRHPAVSVQATPTADAILVLGGALAGAHPPRRPTFILAGAAGRVWHAAALYRAGKAKWVVISGGNQPGQEAQQVEAQAMAQMLAQLGVPESAMRLETTSRNTRENAANVRALLDQLRVRRVLLVTSAFHMPRAVKTFATVLPDAGLQVIPISTDVQVTEEHVTWQMWLPSLEGLLSVSKAVKEIAGLGALDIM